MDTLRKLYSPQMKWISGFKGPDYDPYRLLLTLLIAAITAALLYSLIHSEPGIAAVTRLPGEDASDKLEAAGTLLHILDTGVFKWGARLFAGICIMSSAWSLKEQRFGFAVICVIGAIIFGTAPKWVKNIFEIGDNQGLFSQRKQDPAPTAALSNPPRVMPVERALANV